MDTKQIIAEVARETGIRLDSDDPILAAAVINEILLVQTLARFNRQMKAEMDRMTAASVQSVNDAEKRAEVLLNEAGGWVEKRMKETAQEVASMILSKIENQTKRAERAATVATRIAWCLGITALVAISGVCGMVVAGLKFG